MQSRARWMAWAEAQHLPPTAKLLFGPHLRLSPRNRPMMINCLAVWIGKQQGLGDATAFKHIETNFSR